MSKGIFKPRPKKKRQADTYSFMKLQKSLRAGGSTVSHGTRKLFRWFNNYTQGTGEPVARRFFTLTPQRYAALLLAVVLIFMVTLLFFDNNNIEVDNVSVSVAGLSSELEGYRILHLSDLHGRLYGDAQSTLMRTIDSLTYDLVLISGDMVGVKGDAQPFYDLLGGLSGDSVYFIAGDSDPGPLLETPRDASGALRKYVLEDWILRATDMGANYLDAPVKLKKGESSIWLSPEWLLSVDTAEAHSKVSAQVRAETELVVAGDAAARSALPFTSYRQAILKTALDSTTEMQEGDLHIALSHYPPTTAYLSAIQTASADEDFLRPVDLVLSGHYCGGVWKLPIIGAFYIPAVESESNGWFPSQSEVEGLRLLSGVNVYVNGGLGSTDVVYLPDFRLGNKPKVALITLTSALTDDLLGSGA